MWQLFILTEQLIFFHRTIILFIEQILQSKYFFIEHLNFTVWLGLTWLFSSQFSLLAEPCGTCGKSGEKWPKNSTLFVRQTQITNFMKNTWKKLIFHITFKNSSGIGKIKQNKCSQKNSAITAMGLGEN